MLIGAHESVAGGLHTAFARGEADGCEAMQLWTGYNTRWAPRVIDDEDASRFRSEAAELLGLTSAETRDRKKSIETRKEAN